jgi:ribosomal protein S18 acetylase RimI-like enzyme
VAFAFASVGAVQETAGVLLNAWVHPEAAGESTVQQVVRWGILARASLAATLPLFCPGPSYDPFRTRTLDAQGFVRQERATVRMVRPLTSTRAATATGRASPGLDARLGEAPPVPPPMLPAGVSLHTVDSAADVDALAHAVATVFGWPAAVLAPRVAWMKGPERALGYDILARDATGAVLAFCVCHVAPATTDAPGTTEAWTDPIGTIAAARGRGLATAVLRETLRRLQSHGVSRAVLGTSTANRAAMRLFESVGYHVAYEGPWYRLDP